ncbi:hypothetical protein CPAR01_10733 [Colletotrichum paranaense]|uniref:Uncharacterized protein n=1 Tax=Colletotrichum paranaense TaxID=1914294 RepID=A0ABQ9SEV4_9PEZI|nr:uncharacterized protein CPAR01_10733 [Colletotrichum paranaense]KAK1534025.1 hypothetical protein CPAR01_10733 [Colletotrichum paranaense]
MPQVQTTVCLCLYGTKVPKHVDLTWTRRLVLKSAELNQCARLTFSRQENGASGCAIERSMSPPIGQLQLPNMDTLYASPSCAIPLPIATLPAATGISGIKREILDVKVCLDRIDGIPSQHPASSIQHRQGTSGQQPA